MAAVPKPTSPFEQPSAISQADHHNNFHQVAQAQLTQARQGSCLAPAGSAEADVQCATGNATAQGPQDGTANTTISNVCGFVGNSASQAGPFHRRNVSFAVPNVASKAEVNTCRYPGDEAQPTNEVSGTAPWLRWLSVKYCILWFGVFF